MAQILFRRRTIGLGAYSQVRVVPCGDGSRRGTRMKNMVQRIGHKVVLQKEERSMG